MTTNELQAIARDIIPPVGAATGQAIAMVDHELGGTLSNGYPSGLGGRTTYRAGFLVHGRQRIAVGPAFDDGRVARRLVRILNGDVPTPRPVPETPAAGTRAGSVEPSPASDVRTQGRTEAPVPPRLCAGCGRALARGARSDRRTCSRACRVAEHRRRQAEAAAAPHDSGTRPVTPTRPSEAQLPLDFPAPGIPSAG